MPIGFRRKHYKGEIPCNHKGVIVWESKEGDVIAVQCAKGHAKASSHVYPVYIIEK